MLKIFDPPIFFIFSINQLFFPSKPIKSCKPADTFPVAKKDAFETINAINSGKYKLISVSDNAPMIAKMDAFIVQHFEINENPILIPQIDCDCKNWRP